MVKFIFDMIEDNNFQFETDEEPSFSLEYDHIDVEFSNGPPGRKRGKVINYWFVVFHRLFRKIEKAEENDDTEVLKELDSSLEEFIEGELLPKINAPLTPKEKIRISYGNNEDIDD